MMRVTVRLFAMLRDAAGADGCDLLLAPGACGQDAKTQLARRFDQLAGHLRACRLAVNAEYQPWEIRLQDGDELCFIPPVSGG